MATLTEVSGVARKAVKIGIACFILLLLYPVIAGVAKRIYLKYHPPPPPPPTSIFGKLPPLVFPKLDNQVTPTLKLETISGGLPSFKKTAKVYLVSLNKSRLLTLDRYRQKAVAIGLTADPIQIDDRRYAFVHPSIPATLTVDLITDQLDYKYDWTRDKAVIEPGNMEASEQVVSQARTFFNQMGILPTEMNTTPGKVMYFISTGSALTPVNDYNEATFARADLFRAPIDNMEVVTSGGNTSPVNVTISGSTKPESKIVAANFYYSRVVGNDIFGTYLIKPVDKAYQELQEGKGFIVKNALPSTTIRTVTMAYYESSAPQDYLQPVYVFDGDGGFKAYVQAIDDSMITPPATAK